jgi:hypothetical protein
VHKENEIKFGFGRRKHLSHEFYQNGILKYSDPVVHKTHCFSVTKCKTKHVNALFMEIHVLYSEIKIICNINMVCGQNLQILTLKQAASTVTIAL